MKALLKILILSLLVQPFVFASIDCYDSFAMKYNIIDNKSFELSDVDMNADFESSPVNLMKEAIAKVAAPVAGCEALVNLASQEKEESSLEVSCAEVMPGKSYSRVCFAESEIGYFFLKSDMLGNLNLSYNRWD